MRKFFVFIAWLLSTSIYAAPEPFVIDASHSFVLWHISHFGFSNPSGKWSFGGKLMLDEAKPDNSKIEAHINVANPITGVPKLDEHLKTADFFDIEKYPSATFVSDKVKITGKNRAKVQGTLTLHGVSKPVTLDVQLDKLGEHPINHKKTAGFSATTTIKRSDFGISQYLPGLGDEVKIEIVSEASLEH